MPSPRRLGTILGTPVLADVSAPLNVVGVWGLCWLLIAARYPQKHVILRFMLCNIWTTLFLLVFLVHSMGHIISARIVGAPMSTLMLNAVHWITLYSDEQVTPGQHIGRSAGGPVANVFAITLMRFVRQIVPAGAFGRDLVDVFAYFNLVLGGVSLLPVQTFDGGVLLKWLVYESTEDYTLASRTVQQASLTAASGLGVLGGIALLVRRKFAAMILGAFGLVCLMESMRRD